MATVSVTSSFSRSAPFSSQPFSIELSTLRWQRRCSCSLGIMLAGVSTTKLWCNTIRFPLMYASGTSSLNSNAYNTSRCSDVWHCFSMSIDSSRLSCKTVLNRTGSCSLKFSTVLLTSSQVLSTLLVSICMKPNRVWDQKLCHLGLPHYKSRQHCFYHQQQFPNRLVFFHPSPPRCRVHHQFDVDLACALSFDESFTD